jgi:hypothetical protein
MVEQRYRAVVDVLEQHVPVIEVAARYGVTRQSVHNWVRRYLDGGIQALANRSRRPRGCRTRSAPKSKPASANCSASTQAGDHGGWSTSWPATTRATWTGSPPGRRSTEATAAEIDGQATGGVVDLAKLQAAPVVDPEQPRRFDAVELEVIVPESGTVKLGRFPIRVGHRYVGERVTIWAWPTSAG